jgi:hypothetical protein
MRKFSRFLAALLLAACGSLAAETAPDAGELAQRVEELKLQSVNLARDLWLLEEELGEPENRLVVFLSVDPRIEDRPEEVELKLGGETVARHSYTAAEHGALRKGGAHRLYAATLAPGRHVLEAQLSTRGDAGRTRPGAKLSFRSGEAPKTIELRLEETAPGQAELTVREWD